MNWLITFTTVTFSLLISYCVVNKERASKYRLLRLDEHSDDYVSKNFSQKYEFIILCIVTGINIVTAYYLSINSSSLLNQLKMSVSLICMSGVCVNDYREHRIPDVFPAITALSGMIFLMIGFITDGDNAIAYIASSALATVVTVVSLLIVNIIVHQGIGMGDIKILAAIALTGGVYVIIGTLFFGMVMSAVIALGLLILKKKKLDEGIPFGPFIYLGFVLTIILSLY